ncbi:type II toxin-antitoxin system RelE family toxin [Solidesulfovibrio sp.]
MPYAVIIKPSAEKEIRKLPDCARAPILSAIKALAGDPRPHGCKKLTARVGYRFRVGNYRIIYDIQDSKLIIEVLKIADRKEVYK